MRERRALMILHSRDIPRHEAHKAEVILISDDLEVLEAAQVRLRLPVKVPEWLSPVTSIIPGQLFAMHLAALRNYDPDNPRALSKVTKTR